MQKDISKKPLVEIVTEMTRLEQQIDIKQLKLEKLKLELYQLKEELKILHPEYEQLRLEVVKRFPIIENTDGFQKKIKGDIE